MDLPTRAMAVAAPALPREQNNNIRGSGRDQMNATRVAAANCGDMLGYETQLERNGELTRNQIHPRVCESAEPNHPLVTGDDHSKFNANWISRLNKSYTK
jgi:hypothetical protein